MIGVIMFDRITTPSAGYVAGYGTVTGRGNTSGGTTAAEGVVIRLSEGGQNGREFSR